MRLPFPARISYKVSCTFAVALVLAQLLEGTNPLFSLGSFLFIMIATAAFNEAGGFSRTSGSYVFSFAMLVVIIGLTTKAVVGEAADTNLETPLLDMWVYVGSITAMYGAAFVSTRLTPPVGLLENLIVDSDMLDAATGCMVTGLTLTLLLMFLPRTAGGVLSALGQINRFLPMAVILGTIYQIRKSGGTSAVNSVVLFSGAMILVSGLVSFSKEGIFLAPVAWLVAAASQRYRLSLKQVAGLAVGVLIVNSYLVPYSQYGRAFQLTPSSTNLENAIYLLQRLPQVRELDRQARLDMELHDEKGYFDHNLGFIERLHMIGPDDSLIAFTSNRGPVGLYPIYAALGNLVPHFLWPSKPAGVSGNDYAHQIGRMSDEDTTTGISFSPAGEAFRIAGWYGVFIVAPAVWIYVFTVFNALCGGPERSPWGLLAVLSFAHIAPEGMLSGPIWATVYVSFGIIFAALTSAYLMPIIGGLVKGPQRRRMVAEGPVRAIAPQGAIIEP